MKERVELHCHTTMSSMDGVASPKEVVEFAKKNGMKAVAITDHGNILAHQELPHYLDKDDEFKIIYGMEGYVVNDMAPIFEGSSADGVKTIGSNVVVVDLETTGFSPVEDEITELAVVKIVDGKLSEEFSCLVNPGKHIPENITELTGIGDEDVKDAEGIEVMLPKFLDFIGDSVIVSHNASFDMGFIIEKAKTLGIEVRNSEIDTLTFARALINDVTRYALASLADYFDVDYKNCHRAVDDTRIAAQVYLKLINLAREHGVSSFEELNLIKNDNFAEFAKKLPAYHISILAKNEKGREALCELVSMSNLEYYRVKPQIPLSELLARRDGLLLGSACEAGMLGAAIWDKKPDWEIEKIAAIFDYLEVQPLINNMWHTKEIGSYKYADIDQLEEFNRRIITLGEKLSIPVVATSDVHFLRPEDGIIRSVVQCEYGFSGYDNQNGLFFRTTEEMINSFIFEGYSEEKAYEIVVENSHLIADQIEKMNPICNRKFNVFIDGAADRLTDLCESRLIEKYSGDRLEAAKERLAYELKRITENDFSSIYILWYELLKKNAVKEWQYSLRGSAASSIVCYLLGISHVDPLDEEVPLYAEFFQGFKGDKEPDIDMNFDEVIWKRVIDSTKLLPGVQDAIRATYQSYPSDEDVDSWIEYYEKRETYLEDDEKERIKQACKNVLCDNGIFNPCGVMLIPEGVDVNKCVPFDMDIDRTEKTIHFQYYSVDHMFHKFDILAHPTCTMNSKMAEMTGYYPSDEDIRNQEIIELFLNNKGLVGENGNIIGEQTGMLAVPGFMNEFMIKLLKDLKPSTFGELVKVECLSHGTNAWEKNAEILVRDDKADISSLIATREDVFETLLSYGMDREEAFRIAEGVRKGLFSRGRTKAEYKQSMINHGVPDWFIWSCEQVRYLFPRSHGAEYVQMELRSLYYKLHYPELYYKVFFETYAPDKVKEYYANGIGDFSEYEMEVLSDKKATMEELYFLNVWREMNSRLK